LIVGGRFHNAFYLDCWSYDTASGAINELSSGPKNCHPRAYHTATLVDGVVWVIGGADKDTIIADDPVWCFDVKTRVWTQPKLKGQRNLLHRTSHGACVHPTMPGCILLFGGYGIITEDQTLGAEWLSDLVVVNTRTDTVESLKPKGKVPIARGYHSFSAVGSLCITVFGRTSTKSLIPTKKSVSIFDAVAGTWLEVADKDIKGLIPQVRSSHGASSVTTSGGGNSVGGVLLFGGAPASASEKERLTDLNYLKIYAVPQGTSRGRNGSSSSAVKYQLEWLYCGDGTAADEILNGEWPLGRAAHAQELFNGKLYLFGGYCGNENYCMDVWEGSVVGEGGGSAVGGGLARGAVCNDPTAVPVDIAPKWKNARVRGEADNIPQNILPTKRQRAAAVKTTLPVQGNSKRVKKQFLEEVIVVDEPNTISPEVVPGARRISALEREVKTLQTSLSAQRAKEAELLREAKLWKSEVDKLKQEVKTTDEKWRAAAAEGQDWRFKFEEQQKLANKALTEKNAAFNEAVAADQRCQEANRRSKASNAIADQKQQALEVASETNTRLQSRITALEEALEQANARTDKERKLRLSIQEQNDALQEKMNKEEADKKEFQRQLHLAQTSFESNKMQWESAQGRLQGELNTVKNALLAAQSELEAAKRNKNKLEIDIAEIESRKYVLQDKVQRLEIDLKTAAEDTRKAEAEIQKLKGDLNDLQRSSADEYERVDQFLKDSKMNIQRFLEMHAASGTRRR
jgi:hypothetical protein